MQADGNAVFLFECFHTLVSTIYHTDFYVHVNGLHINCEYTDKCKEKNLDTHPFFVYDITGDDMEKIVEQGMLYDFYGELLTPHQRRIYEDVIVNDMSLSEIAEEQGISRQGVHDLVRRCDRILEEYERKLGLVQKFHETRRKAQEIRQAVGAYRESQDAGLLLEIEQNAKEIMEL